MGWGRAHYSIPGSRPHCLAWKRGPKNTCRTASRENKSALSPKTGSDPGTMQARAAVRFCFYFCFIVFLITYSFIWFVVARDSRAWGRTCPPTSHFSDWETGPARSRNFLKDTQPCGRSAQVSEGQVSTFSSQCDVSNMLFTMILVTRRELKKKQKTAATRWAEGYAGTLTCVSRTSLIPNGDYESRVWPGFFLM